MVKIKFVKPENELNIYSRKKVGYTLLTSLDDLFKKVGE